MTRRALVTLGVAVGLTAQTACASFFGGSTLPERLSDQEFWSLSTSLSEPPGTFEHSDNLVSNELLQAQISRLLRESGGVYIGVGPEQNFSYIVRLRPQMAFVVDIRSENRSLHLLYKALFELSPNRVDFTSRLFSRERPTALGTTAAVDDLFVALSTARPSTQLRDQTLQMVRRQLAELHRFVLTDRDLHWIDYALNAFFLAGPDIRYGREQASDVAGPSYRVLMTTTDLFGQARSYLASESAFAIVKDLQSRNLIVPVVGDFAGPAALRRIGDYVRRHRSRIRAFYGSNVDVYLNRERTKAFCANLSSLPFEPGARFIGNKGIQLMPQKIQDCSGPAQRTTAQ